MTSSPHTTLGAQDAFKCELASEVLRSSGSLRLKVTGWSMLPSVWPGDTLMIDRVEPASLSAGDIVLFGRDRRLFAHRVVAAIRINASLSASPSAQDFQFITQGDGMPRPDPPVPGSEVLGKVSFIVRNGRLIAPERPSLPERAIGALVGRSDAAARVVVGVHGMHKNSEESVTPCPS